jgi:hypothetical protein
VQAEAPVVLYSRVRDSDWQLQAPLVWRGWQGDVELGMFEVEGEVTMMLQSLEVRAGGVRINGRLRLKADLMEQPPHLPVHYQAGMRMWRGACWRTCTHGATFRKRWILPG